jgi:hypothetical protein
MSSIALVPYLPFVEILIVALDNKVYRPSSHFTRRFSYVKFD